MKQMLNKLRSDSPVDKVPEIPFAPLAKRQGEAYAQARQYVEDLQQEVELLKTKNEELTSRLSLLEGANERLHEENERILKQAQQRHDQTQDAVYGVHRQNAALLALINSCASILIEGVKQSKTQQANTEQLIAAVETAIIGDPAESNK